MKHMATAAKQLGIRPWEWALLTVEEADAVCDICDQYVKDCEKAEAQAKRG